MFLSGNLRCVANKRRGDGKVSNLRASRHRELFSKDPLTFWSIQEPCQSKTPSEAGAEAYLPSEHTRKSVGRLLRLVSYPLSTAFPGPINSHPYGETKV
jgi:hypothetical protein